MTPARVAVRRPFFLVAAVKRQTTTIRLLEDVDNAVREKIRMHGDLAALIDLAILQADFAGTKATELRGRPQAGAKAASWSRPTSVWLSQQARERLADLADETGLSRNTVINKALSMYLERNGGANARRR